MNNSEENNYGKRFFKMFNDWFLLLDEKFTDDMQLQMQQLTLLGVLNGLSETGKPIYISNQALANQLHVKKSVIRDWLTKLEACGIISKRPTKEYATGRIIIINHDLIKKLCLKHATEVAESKEEMVTEGCYSGSIGGDTTVTGVCDSGSRGDVTQVAPNILINKQINKKININMQEEADMAKKVKIKCRDTGAEMERDLAFQDPNRKTYYWSSEEAYNNRPVLCIDTQKELPWALTYEDNSTAKTRYWSSETAFKKYNSELDYKNKCIDLMFEILGYKQGEDKLNSTYYDYLANNKQVGYENIYNTIVGEKDNLMYLLENKSFNTDYNKMRYLTTIIDNNIMNYKNANKQKQKMEEVYNHGADIPAGMCESDFFTD